MIEPDQLEPTSAISINQPTLTKPRIVVKNSLYYQAPNQSPTSFDLAFSKWLESDEQPFLRHCKIGEVWKPLDLGWLESVSLLTIINVAPTWAVNPTDEEKKEAVEKTIELGISHSAHPDAIIIVFATIPVGEGLQLRPEHIDRYRIRCRKDEARCSMLLLPT